MLAIVWSTGISYKQKTLLRQALGLVATYRGCTTITSTALTKPTSVGFLFVVVNYQMDYQSIRWFNYLLLFTSMQLRPYHLPMLRKNIFTLYHAMRQSLKFSSHEYQLIRWNAIVSPLRHGWHTYATQLCYLSCAAKNSDDFAVIHVAILT